MVQVGFLCVIMLIFIHFSNKKKSAEQNSDNEKVDKIYLTHPLNLLTGFFSTIVVLKIISIVITSF